MPNESAYVQVATDGSGKKIANVSVTDVQAVDTSGNAQADLTRYEQVVTLADARGNLVDIGELLTDIRDQQARTNDLLQLLLMKFG